MMRKWIVPMIALMLFMGALESEAKSDRIGTKVYSSEWFNVNNCQIPVTNYGEFGYMYGFWPKGSGEPYIFGSGIWIGAVKNDIPMVSCGYNPIGPGNDFMPGPPEHNENHAANPNSHPEDRVLLSTLEEDLAIWPLRDSLDNPIILSDLDMWCEYNDCWPDQHAWDPGTGPLNLHIRQLTFGWTTKLYVNMFFLLYEIENVGEDRIEGMYIGNGADMDIGDSNDDLTGCDVPRSLGYTHSLSQESGWSSKPPYYVGVKFLQGPKADDTVFVAAPPGPDNPDYPNTIMDTVLPGEHLVLTSFTKCTREKGGDPANDEERYEMLSGYNIETHDYDPWQGVLDEVPSDKRQVMGCGPFSLDPGEVDTFLVGIMFSNAGTGGLEYLQEESDLAKWLIEGSLNPHQVQVMRPNGGEEISGNFDITWSATSVTGNPLLIDISVSNDSGETWTIVDDSLGNSGTYSWNTNTTPDGFYFLKVFAYDTISWGDDISDGEFIINNPGNGYPQAKLLSPNGGEFLSGIETIRWWARDPDGDIPLIGIFYTNDGGKSWYTVASNELNDGLYSWNTERDLNGEKCLIKITAFDGSLIHSDSSDSYFSIQNSHTPAGDVVHTSGNSNTVTIIPYIIRSEELTGHIYEVRFRLIKETDYYDWATYSYDVYDLTEGSYVLLDQSFAVSLDNTPLTNCSPLFDGISIETDITIDGTSFIADSIKVTKDIGTQYDTLATLQPFNEFTAKWAFHGARNIEIHWNWYNGSQDTITMRAFDIDNNSAEIPYDSAFGDNWCFGLATNPTNKDYLTGTQTPPYRVWFYVSGVQYYFNKPPEQTPKPMNWATHPDSGDVWTTYNSGDRPPCLGDIYQFQVTGIEEKSEIRNPKSEIIVYPNPFRSSVNIRIIGIKESKNQKTKGKRYPNLRIYDLSGRLIRTLLISNHPSPINQIVWNGRDKYGKEVPSGIYFLKLETDALSSKTEKVVLVR